MGERAGAMGKLIICGGQPLHGRVRAGGRKNSAVAILPAALLAPSESRIEGVPEIGDVSTYLDILAALGAEVGRPGPTTAVVAANGLDVSRVPYEMMKRLRASYYLLGVLLGKYGEAEVPLPGGCDIGQRPVDQHLKGFRALGAEVDIRHGVIRARARRLQGARLYLDVTSVGATINIMLAAVLAEGTTIIENAAKEPHVVDVATFVNAMGARVVGAGTDVIKVHGVERLHGCEHTLIPDEIEAATYMMAVAATGGDAVVENVIPRHLEPIAAKLREAGATVEENGDSVRVVGPARPRPVDVKTLPYPGFPTDAQQPMTAVLSRAEGTSTVTETIWDGRFKHVDELKRMGTRIRVEGRTAIIQGVEQLSGAPVQATDLRAGAALIVAGLAAEGETEVAGMEHVERGYERCVEKLADLGADVRRPGLDD
jgi:UDP-N-acetylglucosamine 1-carboxyvinyltransferase